MVRLSVKALCLSAVALVSAKSPLLAWTNKNVADVSSTNFATADEVSTLLAPFLDTCPESVLILDQPDFDIASLKDMGIVKSAFAAAKSALQIGHFESEDANNVDVVVNAIAEKCSNAIVSEDKIGEKNSIVISKLSRSINDSQRAVKNLLKKINDETLVVYLSNNKVDTKKFLVQRDDAAQNQEGENKEGESQNANAGGNQANTNSTVIEDNDDSTFHKYVFFNTAIFEGLVVMCPFMLILIIGVSWIISVQTPTRFPKKKDN